MQTDEVVVDELRGRNHFVPLTLIREKGTYGTVTVNFEVSRLWNRARTPNVPGVNRVGGGGVKDGV